MNTKVKVIKRNQQPVETIVASENKSAKAAKIAAREAVATVTGWVADFQQKRREETKEAIKKFFGETQPQTGAA